MHVLGNDTALEKLTGELTARGYEARLTIPGGRPPWLAVIGPAATKLAETVMADAEWFWWPWADRIELPADVATAAGAIATVPALAPAGDGQ
jgi:hypothetical protein